MYGKQLLGAVELAACRANVVRKEVSGSSGFSTVNLCGQITSEYVKFVRECPARVSHKSVAQECGARVPRTVSTRVSYKSVAQECPTRVSHESVPQECFTRVSPTGVSNNVWAFVFEANTCLHSGSWVPYCYSFSAKKLARENLNEHGTLFHKRVQCDLTRYMFCARGDLCMLLHSKYFTV